MPASRWVAAALNYGVFVLIVLVRPGIEPLVALVVSSARGHGLRLSRHALRRLPPAGWRYELSLERGRPSAAIRASRRLDEREGLEAERRRGGVPRLPPRRGRARWCAGCARAVRRSPRPSPGSRPRAQPGCPACLLSTSTSMRSGPPGHDARAASVRAGAWSAHSRANCSGGGVVDRRAVLSATGLSRNCPAFTCASASATVTRLTNLTRDRPSAAAGRSRPSGLPSARRRPAGGHRCGTSSIGRPSTTYSSPSSRASAQS